MKKIDKSNKSFEDIKHIDENGVEFWYARELMTILEYNKWENFEKVINKAKEACENGRVSINDKVAKPSTNINEGDIIEITFANRKLKARIINIAEHVKKENAKEMYEILEGEEDKE